MWIGREATSSGLESEMVELTLAETALDERPRVDTGCSMTLEEDVVAWGAVVLASEEVVDPTS